MDVRDLECCVRDGAIVGFHRANIHLNTGSVGGSRIAKPFGVAASQTIGLESGSRYCNPTRQVRTGTSSVQSSLL